jgi:hypothetical protein
MPIVNPHRVKFEHSMSLDEKWRKFLIIMGDSLAPDTVFDDFNSGKKWEIVEAYRLFRVAKDNYISLMAMAYAEVRGIKDHKQKLIKEIDL